MNINEAIELAKHYSQKAYAPYSNFRVGAVIVSLSGKVYGGCNIENASYGLTICAERVAIFKALSEGENKFSFMVVYGDTQEKIFPCGACLQVLSEFCPPDFKIFCINSKNEIEEYMLKDLFPKVFKLKR